MIKNHIGGRRATTIIAGYPAGSVEASSFESNI
jgi:hypothetical protein